ncbi:Crp/Fnr family transcriptional regulator [Clostridium frigidicarnis]|uniref:cAMP-binding domain of CRP or a regulatory subunit of cAMP-dependent protein kinases n=1 Tax=Clostridium frigidicarnis TaxID=84698 RepID=A0A1I0YJ66_9CLOT|nr:Crp/Fnr family transcriptional regulator [Clostridium frigidicarnis]SFB12826.1 cAMP-binding domain of CRP or a regulatory subunit of cAMP-dependent protein kinases [Clostridium frigidicarnis]
MKMKDICIYNNIKEYLDEINIIDYHKGQYISTGDENLESMFFILSGVVKVECITKEGKTFLVDILYENEFVGKISEIYDQNLFCDIIATSEARLLKINKDTFKKLQKNPEFLNIFFFKTSKRIYNMYKKLIMKDLFRFDELFASYILENCDDNIFKFKSVYNLCKMLSTSRKNLYNTINKFISKGYILKRDNSIIILNKKTLIELSYYVKEFRQKNTEEFKFNIF